MSAKPKKKMVRGPHKRDERVVQDEDLLLKLGSLSNYYDDDNDDFKTTIGLMIKKTALHVHHAF